MATPKYLQCNLSGNQQPYGTFLTRKFVDQVINVIEEANEGQKQGDGK